MIYFFTDSWVLFYVYIYIALQYFARANQKRGDHLDMS